MNDRLPEQLRDANAGLTADQVTTGGRARLVDITHTRLVYSICASPIASLPFIAWLYLIDQPAGGVIAWAIAYTAAALAVWRRRQAWLAKPDRQSDPHTVDVWQRSVQYLALAHGIGLGVAAVIVVLTAPAAPFEFFAMLYCSAAGTIALNATHQTPILGAFQRFFATNWGVYILLTPWAFPLHWHVVVLLELGFAASIYRHALIAHRFFVQQVRLESHGIRLAEQYRLAKEQAEQATLQAERALREKNLFLTTASHDLRQPVHAMGFLIESIAYRNQDSTLVPALADLRQSVRSVSLMFNSLLDLSKLESGALAVHLQPVALLPLFQDVATLFREEANSRGLSLRIRTPSVDATVLADASLLRQCLINLIHNGLRYTTQGGVLLSARLRGGYWIIEVWDTGMGVPSADLPRIYSPFYRHRQAQRADNAGYGLGLAVVARCAQLMGITYGMASTEGRGSRFWFRMIPVMARQAPPPSAQSGLLTPRTALAGTCLVVDDDPQVQNAWLSLMQAWGVDVRCAANAAQAMAILDGGFVPQAVLCDQRLRCAESGFDVLRTLLERCPSAHGAMVSGELNAPELVQAESDGYLVLRKPVDTDTLHTLLATWLRRAA